MTPINPYSFGFDGEPTPGIAPTQLIVYGELSRDQFGLVQAQYSKFCTAMHLSIAPSLTTSYTLADGSTMRATSNHGVNSVQVWPVRSGNQEASGIGLKLIGWGGVEISQLRGYWLLSYAAGQWTAKRRDMLVGANNLWVNASRSSWLASSQTDQLMVYSRNNMVGRFTAPGGAPYPTVVSAEKRADSASSLSVLEIFDGSVRLHQKGVVSGFFEVADSLEVLPGAALSMLGVAGAHAVVASESTAYKVALSPVLALASSSAILATPATSFSSSGSISFVGSIESTPTSGTPESSATYDWSVAPDIYTNTFTIGVDGIYSLEEAETFVKNYAEINSITYTLIRSYDASFHPAVDGGSMITVTVGLWGSPITYTKKTAGPNELVSALSVYSEANSSSEESTDVVLRGIYHDGSVWRILKKSSINKSITGTTSFNKSSSVVNKSTSYALTETWILPSGEISVSSLIGESYSESVTVPYPSLSGISGSTSVESSITIVRIHFKHYDPDTNCTVFIKEVVDAGGTTSWTKSSTGSYAQASTPVGNYFYAMSSPSYSVTGSSTFSICVYSGTTLSYSEVIATVPATGGSIQYEPKAYPDMSFSFSSSTPKPSGEMWPEQTIVSGPGAEITELNSTAKILFNATPNEALPTDEYLKAHPSTPVLRRPGGWYVHKVPSSVTPDVDLEWSIDRADSLTNVAIEIYPANASGSFSAGVSTAKDAASGALAVEVNYSSPEFPVESRNRSRILLISPSGITRLSDLIKPATPGAFSTDYKTNNFLVTV